MDHADVAIVGAGAAGLMAAIWVGRRAREMGMGAPSIIALDGAKTLGAKILVAGGGRCNVTHDVVDENAYAGSSRHAIRKVLRRFDVTRTIDFFSDLGVALKREDTGKLFPVTDDARTVLAALRNGVQEAGARIVHPWRVESVIQDIGGGFTLAGSGGQVQASSLILATGGKSLPKSGSDGGGYELARSLGHSITPRVFPALVPLLLVKDFFLCSLSGVSGMATIEVRSASGKRLIAFTDSVLCTHFGLSGPGVLDVSRYFLEARNADADSQLVINWIPRLSAESADAELARLGKLSPVRWLRDQGVAERLARGLCEYAGIDGSAPAHQLTREKRRALVAATISLVLPVVGDRGYGHAEVTAGGVPLSEIRLETMESRICPGLFLCGEICDVDGRIGGYNFQWAWSSGFVAGLGAAVFHSEMSQRDKKSR